EFLQNFTFHSYARKGRGRHYARRINMDIVTSIPVRLNRLESMAAFLESVRGRVTARAYDNYVDGGCLEGHDLDDWLDAERELVIKPAAALSTDGKDLIVEMIL